MMRIVLILYSLWAWSVAVIIGCFGLCAVTVIPGVLYRRQAVRFLARLGLFLGGVRLRVNGREQLRSGRTQVLVSNHTSFLDVVVLSAALPCHISYVAKRSLHSTLFIGYFLRAIDTVFLERFHLRSGREDIDEIEQRVQEGTAVLFFPEGTFTAEPGLRPFKLGAFRVAAAATAPVVPLAIRGARRIFRDTNLLLRPGLVEIDVFSPVFHHKFDSTVRHAAKQLREHAYQTIVAANGEGAAERVSRPVVAPDSLAAATP